MNPELKQRCLDCARGIADWLCMLQQPISGDRLPPAGYFPWFIEPTGQEFPANNWNYAFACMGLLTAYKTFGDPRYEAVALAMGRYLKSLQILDSFHGDHHGVIREITPYTTWCYTRDALSGAWGFLELYRHTREAEYLERARLFGEWFLRKGRDDDGWPWWGHQLEPSLDPSLPKPQMCLDIQGSFQGGSLNFLYHLARETGDTKWIGQPFVQIADRFIAKIQQTSGFYASIERATGMPPKNDPQGGLHRANDDLGSLGLLCAYRVTGNSAYLASIEKYLTAVLASQWSDGRFEESVSCIPVVLNLLQEGADVLQKVRSDAGALNKAVTALLDSQSDGRFNPRMRGGLVECGPGCMHSIQPGGRSSVVARSSCYALIVLPKLVTGRGEYLSV